MKRAKSGKRKAKTTARAKREAAKRNNGQAAVTASTQVSIGEAYLPLMDEAMAQASMIALVEGRRGTAKTRSILTILLARMLEHPGARCILARKTRKDLSDTVLVTLEDQVFPAFGMEVPGGKIQKSSRTGYVLPNGSEFVLLDLSKFSKQQSREAAWAYVAEVTELTNPDTVTTLLGCLRQVVVRRVKKDGLVEDAPPFPHQLIADCNPESPGHFANTLAQPAGDDLRRVETEDEYERTQNYNNNVLPTDGKWKRIITHWADNPGYWDHQNWEFNDVGRDYVNRNLEGLSPFMAQRWKHGLWVAAAGTIFPEFREDRHVGRIFNVEDWPVYMFWDPGYNFPAIVWIAVAPNGCLYVIDEIYQGGRSTADHCGEIKRREAARHDAGQPLNVQGRYGDPQDAFSHTAHNIKSVAEQADECGVHLEPWPLTGDTSNEKQMIEAVRNVLKAGRLKVFNCCHHTVNEFQSWMWKKSGDGTISQQDVPENANNHIMDCIKGAVALRIHEKMPKYTVTAAKGSPAAASAEERYQATNGRASRKQAGGPGRLVARGGE